MTVTFGMDPTVSTADAVDSVTPAAERGKRLSAPYSCKNGVSVITSLRDSIVENILTKTVENVMRELDEKEEVARRANDAHSPDRASQLLRATATSTSAVTNNIKGEASQQAGGKTAGPSPPVSVEPSPAAPSDRPAAADPPTRQRDGATFVTLSSDQVTTVSFSSKPTMSTGFSSATLPAQHAVTPSSSETTRVTASDVGAKSGPAAEPWPVPFLWRRCLEEGAVVYYSPSDGRLTTLEAVKAYLLNEETCKCGLQCPFRVEKVFNFEAEVPSKPWALADIDSLNSPVSMACCHRKHIRSRAMALECKKTNNKVAKTTPVKRKSKSTRKSTSSKPATTKSPATSANPSGSENADDSARPAHHRAPMQPLPSVETVASQLRSGRSAETTPPQLLSPNHLNSAMSPRLLSPGHEAMMGSAYNYPPGARVPPPMMQSPPHYPLSPMMAYPMGRQPADSAVMMPGHPSAYYPPQHMSPGYMQPFVHSFPNQVPYDHMSPRPPLWPGAHPMMPLSSAQHLPPIWQPRHSPPTPTAGQKRKRRPSSKSSNGGASDAGLVSPSHRSAGAVKAADPKPVSPEADSAGTGKAEETVTAIKTELRTANHHHHHHESSTADSSAATRPSVIQSPPQVSDGSRLANYAARMSVRLPGPFPTYPNGIPMGAYMDPMYIARHQSPALRPPMPPFMYPSMNTPINPFEQPRLRPPNLPVSDSADVPTSKESASRNATSAEGKAVKTPSGDGPSSKQKLPGINTITSSLGQSKASAQSQPSANGLASGNFPATSLSHDGARIPSHPTPMQMMPGHANPMFYRCYDTSYPGNPPPPAMYLHHPSRAMCPPFPGQYSPNFPYGGQVSPDVSPKRKRKKAKPAAESQSAQLVAAPDDSATAGAKGAKQLNKNGSDGGKVVVIEKNAR